MSQHGGGVCQACQGGWLAALPALTCATALSARHQRARASTRTSEMFPPGELQLTPRGNAEKTRFK